LMVFYSPPTPLNSLIRLVISETTMIIMTSGNSIWMKGVMSKVGVATPTATPLP